MSNRFIAPSGNGDLPAVSGKRRNKAIAPYAEFTMQKAD